MEQYIYFNCGKLCFDESEVIQKTVRNRLTCHIFINITMQNFFALTLLSKRSRIVAVVVDPKYQKLGIGKELVNAAENWANTIGASVIALNSGYRTERSNAHQLYKKLGFEEKSSGFVKVLV